MKGHETRVKVRYSEIDKMGFAYYSHYLVWFEVARTELLESGGVTYRELEEEGIYLPVREASVKYIRPARYWDDIKVFTKIKTLSRVRIECLYEVYNSRGELLATGRTLHIFMSRNGALIRAPIEIYDKISKAFENYMVSSPNSK